MRYEKLFIISVLAATLFAAPFATDVSAQAPKVIRATPDHADSGVDPELTEMRVEFDQDMNQRGMSVCGAGPAFPVSGKPRWIDARTIVLPIKLEPGKRYSLSINCQNFQNFRNADGVAAEIYPIEFACAGAGAEPAAPNTEAQNKAALDALMKAVEKGYSYRDLRGVDWKARGEEFSDRFHSAESASAFARLTAEFLKAAQDPHIAVKVHDFTLGAWSGELPPVNFADKALASHVRGFARKNDIVFTANLHDGTPYLLIAGWTGGDDAIRPALDFIEEHAEAPAMIIDVRINGGGDELLARRVAGCFLTEAVVYSKNRNVNPGSATGFTEVFDRVVEPNPDRKHFGGKVAVLMGPRCMSSNESFLLMMRQSPNCKLIGARSRGSSGNPKPHDLGNGVTVMLPSWQDLHVDGSVLEGKGVEPDLEVNTTPADFAESDPVIEAATKHLSK
jgi:Peptidase family S41